MAFTPGSRLGVYEITAQIGEGGMGQVYLSRDTKLDRDVAIKILPEAFAHDADRLARFQREAKTLASLNHPNIAAIYGLEENGGMTALVMELVEGDDLSQCIARGAIPLDEALPIAKQIAEALEAAHEQGIIHRDLKPANIKVRPDGTVKVLDFGLAKAMEPGGGQSPSASMSPTITTPAMTQAGMILGTAAYMSPEQAKGRTVDKRSDIWAFGAVLYEMLTGTRAFAGEDTSDTLAFVITKEPDWTALPAETPPSVRRLLRRCLEKSWKRRLADVADARIEIDDAARSAEQAGGASVSVASSGAVWTSKSVRMLLAVTGVFGVLAIVFGVLAFRSRSTSGAAIPEVVRLIVPAPNGEALATGSAADGAVAVSPDGRYLTFSTISNATGRRRLWLRALASLDIRPLEGTDDASWPFWSPDSRLIGFAANGQLKTVEVTGGAVRTVCDCGASRGGAWNTRDEIVFSSAVGPLFRVASGGGTPTPVTMLDASHDEFRHSWPQFLPDGRHFLFFVDSFQSQFAGQYVGSLESPDRMRMSGATPNASYANGFLLYRGDIPRLMAQRFDAATLRTQGEPSVLLDDLALASLTDIHAHFSVSQTGVLAYQSVPLPGTRLVWFDRTGKELGVLHADGEMYVDPEISPDGRQVAVDRIERKTGRVHVVLIDGSRGTMTRLNPELTADAMPVWSKDGKSLVLSGESQGQWGLYLKPLEAATLAKTITRFANPLTYPTDWSTDAETVMLLQLGQRAGVFALTMKTANVTPVADGGSQGRLSPDQRWLAYISSESGQREIYVRSMSGPDIKRVVSNGGGQSPRWRADGRELFYANDRAIMAVDVTLGASLELGRPRKLFEHAAFMNAQPAPTPNGSAFSVSADGQRFLLDVLDEHAPQSPITVVLNWQEELKRLVPTK